MEITNNDDKTITLQCSKNEIKMIIEAMDLGLTLFSMELWNIVKNDPEQFTYSRKKYDKMDELHDQIIAGYPGKYKKTPVWTPMKSKGDATEKSVSKN